MRRKKNSVEKLGNTIEQRRFLTERRRRRRWRRSKKKERKQNGRQRSGGGRNASASDALEFGAFLASLIGRTAVAPPLADRRTRRWFGPVPRPIACRVVPSCTEFHRGDQLSPDITEFYRVLPSFTEFSYALPCCAALDWVLPSFTGFYRVLLGFTEFS